MTSIKCLKCKREWNYKGKKKWDNKSATWVCCPKCRNQVKLIKEEMKDGNDGIQNNNI